MLVVFKYLAKCVLASLVSFVMKGKGKICPRTGNEGQKKLYSFFNLGNIREWVVKATPPPLFPRESTF
jgi:hypothetical protein